MPISVFALFLRAFFMPYSLCGIKVFSKFAPNLHVTEGEGDP